MTGSGFVSSHIASHLLGRFRSAWPFIADARPWPGGASLDRLRARLANVDVAAALIRFADRIEIGFGYIRSNLARLRHLPRLLRVPDLGLGGGLLWRSLAAATGIGLTAALVTALAPEREPTIASLAVQPAQDIRPVRNVRQEPRPSLGGRENWIPITKPIPMFGLESPELERASATLEARRSQDGSQREDVLGFGSFAEPKAHLLLRLSVEHDRTELSQPFVVALVREAAMRAMSVQRSGLANAIQTRFGPVETADATLSDGDLSRSCIAFRMDAGAMPLSMSGWWCGGEGKPADRQQLVCLIDRIDLLNAGDDRALRSAFARTELNRQPACAPSRLAASGRKASWLDADGATPALRTKSAANVSTKPQPKR
ncbi:MAG TPA: hypothetical protein VGN82_02195 [Bosea sp. (in: a-proteobacteria)]|jgi:hypothetical protein|uniref:hypothetical protein n=1 Tax=Bosea sp. (in: a-proteobacteria) TaxID=1871050 RepID=UPI002E1099C0|nr:hypothetical protein [Bosea sp. (in: a-proteobacteria)]